MKVTFSRFYLSSRPHELKTDIGNHAGSSVNFETACILSIWILIILTNFILQTTDEAILKNWW